MGKIGGGKDSLVSVRIGNNDQWLQCRENLWGIGLGVITQDKDFTGYVVIPRWIEEAELVRPLGVKRVRKWEPSYLRHTITRSLYYARRQTRHILHQYGEIVEAGESKVMLEAIKQARELSVAILGLRKANVSEYQTKISQMADQLDLLLGNVRELFKSQAKDYVDLMNSMLDKSGKVNESAKMAQSVALKDRLTARLEQGIQRIVPVIKARQKAIQTALEFIYYRVCSASEFLNALTSQRFDAIPLLQWKAIACRLCQIANDLEEIDINPFRRNCEMCANELRAAADSVKNGSMEITSMQALFSANNSLLIKKLQWDLENLILSLTHLIWRVDERPTLKQANIFQGPINSIKKLLGASGKINEEWLKHPVLGLARSQFAKALKLLEAKNPDDLEAVKDMLKGASVVM